MSPAAAYSTFNMGCGFVVYCARGYGEEVVRLALQLGFQALVGGVTEDGPRRVILTEPDVVFDTDEMNLAPRGAG
jgi:phosphoribosylaminoimidazole (AIR) synthetase